MEDNPYDSSAPVAEQQVPATEREKRSRPVGIVLLAVLHLFGGAALLAILGYLLADYETTIDGLGTDGIPMALFFGAGIAFAVLVFASGVGMWVGAKWAWWCGAFYYISMTASNALGLLIYYVAQLVDIPFNSDKGAVDFVGKIVVHGLIYLYFLKGSVFTFFGLQETSRLTASAILAGITVVLFVAVAATTAVFIVSR